MIELVFLDYKENQDLDLRITQYVNENLEEIIHFAWDEIEASGDIERFSPIRLAAQSREECLLRIRELWQFSQDGILHVDLSPVYQYHLYQMIDWYISILSYTDDDPISANEPIIVWDMDADLQAEVVAVYGEYATRRFSDVKSYLGEFFEDWDFLPESLASVVQLYLANSPLFYNMTSIEELEEYAELMDGDTYKKYMAIRAIEQQKHDQHNQKQSHFDSVLKSALLTIQKDRLYWDKLENEINDQVCNLLRMIYHVNDQTRQGESATRQSAGSVDFLVKDHEVPIAIMEALVLQSLDRTKINEHIEKLLVNYDPQGYPRACLIMYVTQKNFGMFWDNFAEYISEYNFSYSVEHGLTEGRSYFTESRNAYMILKRSNRPVVLSFHAIHLREKTE